MFEDKIKDSLENIEPKFNEEAWNNIEKQVLNHNRAHHSKAFVKKAMIGTAAAGLVVASSFFLLTNTESQRLNEVNSIINVAEVENSNLPLSNKLKKRLKKRATMRLREYLMRIRP